MGDEPADETPTMGDEAANSDVVAMEIPKDGGGSDDKMFEVFDSKVDSAKCTIVGDESQVLTLQIAPGEIVKAEPGCLIHMSDNLVVDTNMAENCFGRACCLRASCCMTEYSAASDGAYVGLTPNFPSNVISENLASGKEWIVKKSGFMASLGDVSVDISYDCCSATCFCGHLGCFRQKIYSKSEGTVFINAGGTIMKKDLAEGESIFIDTGSIVGYESTVGYGLKMIGGCMMCCFGGDGCCAAEMTGPGAVYMQSMSFEKYVAVLTESTGMPF